MKKNYYIWSLVITLCFFPVILMAQDNSSKNLHFVYVAHEVTTPITQLCQKLRSLRDDAEEIDDALIVYLSDGESSLYSFTNLKDDRNLGRDSENAFAEIMAALQDANSHDVNSSVDVSNILSLFEEYDFLKENGTVSYASVTFDFYVGNSFWALGNNEKVITHLYHDFSMEKLSKSMFHINIFVPKTDHLKYPEGQPFGDNNINNINKNLKILTY